MTNTQDHDTRHAPSSSDPPGEASERPRPLDLDEALMRAWSLADTYPALWRESARQDGEVDLVAEDELRRIVADLWVFT
jgi:hypothetical protein